MDANVIILTKYKHLLTHPFAIFNQEKPTDFNYVCITNSKRVVQHLSYYDKSLSFMFSEIIRSLNAITIIDKKGVLCPANWHPGEPVINPKEWSELENKLGTVN
ncbi:Peroxiredoxin-like protein [Shewanella halifaxensis HAW-EB4]|uniref:Peroxiredoxin-like protein n=2 Tax=Shewanella halifaxensis TaxID=271098 RepID=B0TKR0_SHEHH|nr:Peroxiredoxin-like protein [Shewanella halifaxensis HAW-EB4]